MSVYLKACVFTKCKASFLAFAGLKVTARSELANFNFILSIPLHVAEMHMDFISFKCLT